MTTESTTTESKVPVEPASLSEVTAAACEAGKPVASPGTAAKLPAWVLWLVPVLLVTGLAIRGVAVVSYSWKSAESHEEDLFADFDAPGDDSSEIVFGEAVSMSPGEPEPKNSGLSVPAGDIAMPGAFPELTVPDAPGRLSLNEARVTTTGATASPVITAGAGTEFTTAVATTTSLNRPSSQPDSLKDAEVPVWLEGRIELVDEPNLNFSEFPSLPPPDLTP